MTPVAIGDIQRTQGTRKTCIMPKNRYRHLLLCLLCLHDCDYHYVQEWIVHPVFAIEIVIHSIEKYRKRNHNGVINRSYRLPTRLRQTFRMGSMATSDDVHT